MSSTSSGSPADENEVHETEERVAKISRDVDGDHLGLAVFISAEELLLLGVDPTETAVLVNVRNGQICIRPMEDDVER